MAIKVGDKLMLECEVVKKLNEKIVGIRIEGISVTPLYFYKSDLEKAKKNIKDISGVANGQEEKETGNTFTDRDRSMGY